MSIKTRKPTGVPPWPMVLLAGAEKSGKSYAAAQFSASDLIDRTFWIEIGEGAADQYGALPGARYEIVEHDGSYQGILAAVRGAAAERGRGGKPNAIVIDSMTELWELLCNEQQAVANERRHASAGRDATITMDQWNTAKRRWRNILEPLRTFGGPAILTARFEQVAVMGNDGKPETDDRNKPTGRKMWRIRAEKNTPFEVDAIVEIPRPREHFLNGVRTVAFEFTPHMPLPDFTIDGLMRKLGLNQKAGARTYQEPKVNVAEFDRPKAENPVTTSELTAGYDEVPPSDDEIAAMFPAEATA